MTYTTIIIRDDANTDWGVHFGSDDIDDIRNEIMDLRDSGYRRTDIRTFTTDGTQEAIDAYVADANGKKLMVTHTRIRISPAVLRLVEGKITDRITGDTLSSGHDVYDKMIDAGADEYGFAAASAPNSSGVYIEATRADLVELRAEMHWALDGEREITIGERSAAVSLANIAERFIAVLA